MDTRKIMSAMPLELVMKVQVRCDALEMYEKMDESRKEKARNEVLKSRNIDITERIIDDIADGKYL